MAKITEIKIGNKHFKVSEGQEPLPNILKSPNILDMEIEETVFNNNLQVVINGVKFFREEPKYVQWIDGGDEIIVTEEKCNSCKNDCKIIFDKVETTSGLPSSPIYIGCRRFELKVKELK
jgi:hypothetical protein